MTRSCVDDASFEGLREALRISPDNVPIRKLLAQALHDAHRDAEARGVLAPLLARVDAPPDAHLLAARVEVALGEPGDAEAHYLAALAADPRLADPGLAEELGLAPRVGLLAGARDPRIASPATTEAPPRTSFADVGGMEGVKEEIRMKIIHPLERPDLFRSYGKKVGGGILLYGPPGCGKTFLARATAGEAKASFLSVGIHDVLDMWLGQSEQKLHALFETARRQKPCILFFDEVDALGADRADLRGSAGRNTINQFLAELDGAVSSNEGVLVLGATNAPWHVDGAFRRPGRFDRVIFVPPPDEPARAEILRLMLHDKPTAPDVDLRRVSTKTAGFSGADLKGVLDLVVEAKLREALAKGTPAPIGTADLLAAVKRVRPTTEEWFATARNHALYANEGGIYDDVLEYMRAR